MDESKIKIIIICSSVSVLLISIKICVYYRRKIKEKNMTAYYNSFRELNEVPPDYPEGSFVLDDNTII